jgi:hypothetical protein
MNPTLAAIYGLEKTASEEEDLDLTQISGADLLALLSEEEVEKTASDELDLSQISGADLLELLEEIDQEDESTIEKMAGDGTFEYYDQLGRQLLHEDLEKLAEEEDEVYDLSEISAEDTLAMLESGEFEIIEGDLEKEAGKLGDLADAAKARLAAFLRGSGGPPSKPGGSKPRSFEDIARDKQRDAMARQRNVKKITKGDDPTWKERLKEMATGHQAAESRASARFNAARSQNRTPGEGTLKRFRAQERAKGYAARGVPAVGVAGGGAMMLRKKDKK